MLPLRPGAAAPERMIATGRRHSSATNDDGDREHAECEAQTQSTWELPDPIDEHAMCRQLTPPALLVAIKVEKSCMGSNAAS